MNKQDYKKLEDWFLRYTDSFLGRPDGDEENILLKRDHTLRVCQEMGMLTKGLAPEDRYLALATALLHDTGRFEQLVQYGTFSDYKSEDHASLGVKILKELNVLRAVDPVEAGIIIDAVENHNKVEIEEGLSERSLLISELTRDADKLDIWHLVIEHYREGKEKDNPSLVHNFPPGDDVCSPVYESVRQGGTIPYAKLETVVDMKILQMGWIYDLNTRRALELAADRNYLSGIYNTLPHSEKINEIYSGMQEYIERRLKGECSA